MAGGFLNRYGRQHKLDLGDALIAATAYATGSTLYTRNVRHYPMSGDRRRGSLRARALSSSADFHPRETSARLSDSRALLLLTDHWSLSTP